LLFKRISLFGPMISGISIIAVALPFVLVAIGGRVVIASGPHSDRELRMPAANQGKEARQPKSTADSGLPLLEASFRQWLADRPNRNEYGEHHPFPVFLITAQGGGLYAAYHAAVFLATIEDVCPGFTSHIFAISAVSGGSVGASIFASAASARQGPVKAVHCLEKAHLTSLTDLRKKGGLPA
jgi:hypothetical protein